MTSSHHSHPAAAGPASLSGLLTVALATALMVAAPLTMGIAAMQEGRLGRSDAHRIFLADTTAAAAIEHSPATGQQRGSRSRTIVVSPRRFTAPIRLW